MEQSTSWEANSHSASQEIKKFPAFYGNWSSLLCSQEPATGPYPEPYESNPHLPILFP
jgi:hypothetical protein